MLRLKDAIDEKIQVIIQGMIMQFLHSSTALYEADGTNVYSAFEGQYLCHEDCWRVSKDSIDKREPVVRECSGGICIYAVPIMYKDQVIGSINAGVTNPPVDRGNLEDSETEIARMQIRMVALLIEALYEAKVKQLESAFLCNHDITDLVNNERRLFEQNKQLHEIIDNMSEALFVFDKDGNYIHRNKTAFQCDYSNSLTNVKEFISMSKSYDLDGNEVLTSNIPAIRVLNGERIGEQILSVEVPNGRKYYGFSGAPLFNEDGTFKMGILCVRDITESKSQSQTIRYQKEQLEAIIKNMSDGVLLLDRNNNFILLNKGAKDFFYEPEAIKKNGDSLAYTKYYDAGGKLLSVEELPGTRTLRGETLRNFLLTAVRPDKTVHFSINSSPLLDEREFVDYAIICVRDITEKVEKERLLKEKKEQLEVIMENMREALYVFDKNGKYILTNKAARLRIGRSFDKVGDSNGFIEFFNLQGNKVAIEDTPTYGVLHGRTVTDQLMQMRTPSGEIYVSINGVPIFDEKGELLYGIVMSRDVTEKVKYEQEIREKNQQLEAILENIDDAVFVYDKDKNYYLLNKSAREYFSSGLQKFGDGFTKARYFDLDGKEIPKENMTISKVLRGEIVKNDRMKMVKGDTARYLSVNGSQIYDDNGNINFSVLHSRDITEQVIQEERIKQQQELLLRAEKAEKEALEREMKMKDEFLLTITHEFKTPLAVINAAVQAVNSLYGDQLSDNVRKHIQRIRMNSFRQLRLVNNLLDITRYDAGHIKIQKQNIDIIYLTCAITESVRFFAAQKGVNLEFTTDITYKEMVLDDEKVERILLNLLSNAIKFTPKGKGIYVNVGCTERKAIITVKDEGVGIPENKRELIFERFGQVDSSLTRQAEGTGIGLSLVKALVTVLGGTISLESQVGVGSTFTVSLPITKLRSYSKQNTSNQTDSRIMQAAVIEFSDIYIE